MILNEDLKNKIKNLFQEKKFIELINLIQNKIEPNQRPASLWNLMGVARLSKKNPTKENLVLAINDFKEAYFKEKLSERAVEVLSNLINSSIELFDLDDSKVNLEELIEFYEKSKDFYLTNNSINNAMFRLYKRLNETQKINFHLKKIIESQNFTSSDLCSYIYHQSFNKFWLQEDYFAYGQLLNKNLSYFPKDKLQEIIKIKNKKIRIAFISGDIRNSHSVTYFLRTILEKYDKKKYEIYLILNQSISDETTDHFKNFVDQTINIIDQDDMTAINSIRQLNLDFIFDLMSITSTNRIKIIKNRVAKTQISWLGYCNTSGVENMDYILTDHNLIYVEEHNLYSEKIIYLPQIWNCHSGISYQRKENISPFCKNNYITFCSFNNFNKINDNVINVWSKILKNVKNSKLLIKNSVIKQISKRLEDKFREQGVFESVCILPREINFQDHLKIYEKVDIALDTFPYNGVTTSFEAVYMGVPVLTMSGYNFNSRCGESINNNLKLNYLVAVNESDYISKAINLSNDIDKLNDIRKKVFSRCLNSPLFDASSFSNDFFQIVDNLYKN